MKKFLTILSLVLVVALSAVAFVGCNSKGSKKNSASAPADEGEDLGFTEVEIFAGEEWEAGYLEMNGVYFQAVTMNGGTPQSQADCHLELDVSAMAGNKFGFGEGDWVPYLSVNYKVEKDGETISEGTFMPMAASDGPRYGANIKMAGDGAYKVTFTVAYPDTNTYLIHTDETGPGAVYPTAAYTFTKDWNFKNGAWDE